MTLVLKNLRGGKIERPTMLLDRRRALLNLERMARRAREGGVVLRPHFKTHQSADVGSWFRDYGVTSITVSSFSMARYFASHGWKDVTVAFPVNPRERDALVELAGEIDLGLLLDAEPVARGLDEALSHPVRAWIKIDAGYGRAGIRWDRAEEAVSLARAIVNGKRLRFQGLLTHSGHSYRERGREGVERVHRESVSPTCSVAGDFEGVDEIRPGNFVFHDLMQVRIGSCTEEDIAVALVAPVVGSYPDRRALVLYAGAVHLSKEALDDGSRPCFGVLAHASPGGLGSARWDAPLVSLSQEHGVVVAKGEALDGIRPGDLVAVYPVHACLACDLHGSYRTFEGGTLTKLRY